MLMDTDTLGDRLKKARKRARISQEELANKCNVSQGVISKIERGDQDRSTKTNEFAKILMCDPYWLATGEGEIIPSDGVGMTYIKKHFESLSDSQKNRLIDSLNDMVEINAIKRR